MKIMSNAKTVVPNGGISAFETIQKVTLHADKMGLTLAQCFEPSQFSAKQSMLSKSLLLFISATDGWCWGMVRSVDDRGCLVLEREAAQAGSDPPAQPVPKPPAPPPAEPLPDAAAALRQKRIENMAKARAARTRNAA
jgi:hypothetical protein